VTAESAIKTFMGFEIRCVRPELWCYLRYYKKEVVIVWPGAVHALIGVKFFPQVYSVQQQICAKFHLG